VTFPPFKTAAPGADGNSMSFAFDEEDSRIDDLVLVAEAQAEQIDAAKARIAELEALLARRSTLAEVAVAEIRLPLSRAWTALTHARIDDPVQAVPVTAATDELRRGLNLLDDVGRRPPSSPEPTPREALRRVGLADVLERVVAEVRSRHPGRADDRVVIDAAPELDLVTSPARVIALLVAIIDNSFRHGAHPVHVRARTASHGIVRFDVSDSGPGFRARRPIRRERAASADGHVWRDHEGVGLFAARLLAHTLGGKLAVGDRLGSGAVVTIWLPQRRESDIGAEDGPAEQARAGSLAYQPS